MQVSHQKLIVWLVAIVVIWHILEVLIPIVLIGALLWYLGTSATRILRDT